jgi:hypothetical protein
MGETKASLEQREDVGHELEDTKISFSQNVDGEYVIICQEMCSTSLTNIQSSEPSPWDSQGSVDG